MHSRVSVIQKKKGRLSCMRTDTSAARDTRRRFSFPFTLLLVLLHEFSGQLGFRVLCMHGVCLIKLLFWTSFLPFYFSLLPFAMLLPVSTSASHEVNQLEKMEERNRRSKKRIICPFRQAFYFLFLSYFSTVSFDGYEY